ncbi:MAG: hypothetical protein IPH26_15305 [Sterolibacteriaceae bacterium]|uniref:Tetratricopeptide repeat protein n=1 Tax=Candidatus Methylophosphatis roskildensis TaxID=2899263 RepID=A0A9D7HV17_9PROT|nr:hypothetical protein [Candidatus Methylophosphatis roskildensis]MBK7236959.1 hypothetical protein [Sterolibacteriaceae bacterium]
MGAGPGVASGIHDDWLEEACMGHGLSAEVQALVYAAAKSWDDEVRAEALLAEAAQRAPDHAAVLIARYRFYFYRNRLDDALLVACDCLAKAASDIRAPLDWRAVEPSHANFDSYGVLPRFYLFALKGYAYLNMRLGNLGEGAQALDKLEHLDPTDRLNGSVLRGVLDRMGRDDDD